MKTLQNNFTTSEQSKWLLELGVPADSADCSIDEWGRVHKIPQDNGNLLFSQLKRQTIYTIRPCWSVGRLIEIQEKCTGARFFRTLHPNLLEDIIGQIEYTVRTVGMDFSKLEE